MSTAPGVPGGWVRALHTLGVPEPLPEWIWAAGGEDAPRRWVLRVLRSRLTRARRRHLAHARETSSAAVLCTPRPGRSGQLAAAVAAFNDEARIRSLPDRMAHSQLAGPKRTARGFVRVALRDTLGGAATGRVPDDLDTLLGELRQAADVLRVRLWVVTRAERAAPDLLRLFDAWLAAPPAPPHLLLELVWAREHWLILNLPAPHG